MVRSALLHGPVRSGPVRSAPWTGPVESCGLGLPRVPLWSPALLLMDLLKTQTCDREREIQQQTNIVSALMAALIILLFFLSGAASDLPPQTAHPGENVTLKCVAADAFIDVVKWTRDDLKSTYVFFIIDGHPQPDEQHPSFKDRVELEDRKMENGDVSLVLKNVSSEDSGIYRCRVETGRSSRRKRAILDREPINSIQLEVTGSQKGDFPHVAVGLGASLLLCFGMVIVMGTGFFLGRKRNLDKKSERSAVEAVDLQLI